MRIHALTTGATRVKHSFLFPRSGPRRQLDLFLPGPFSDPLPIHCWAIEHEGVLRLVDTGETAAAHNVPFGRMEVAREQELPAAISAAGLNLDDVSEVVLTHAHGDHIDGLVHVHATVLINETELRFLCSPMARVMRRILRQPLPPGFAPEPFALDGGPFGAFPTSRNLSDDGRIVAVPTPGHTPGHLSVICVHDSGRHVMLAGDATDTLEQLHARRADAIAPDPEVHIATLETILAHCAQHPTIYCLPTTQTQQPASRRRQPCRQTNRSTRTSLLCRRQRRSGAALRLRTKAPFCGHSPASGSARRAPSLATVASERPSSGSRW
jgi:N-acyl homoserine lactone hydrolase